MPCRDAARSLPAQLAALARQRWDQPWEVVLVDDGSSDGSADLAVREAARLGLRLRVVTAEGLGAAAARNRGAADTDAPWLAFVDADDEVADDWLPAVGTALAQHGFWGGALELDRLNQPHTVQVHGLAGGIIHLGLDHPFRPFAVSANLMVWREWHQAVGGFDESFRRLEDVDYSWRMQDRGYELRRNAAAVHYRLRPRLAAICRAKWREAVVEPALFRRHLPAPPYYYSLLPTARWLLTRLPRLVVSGQVRDSARAKRLLHEYAWSLGRLQSSVRHRYVRLV